MARFSEIEMDAPAFAARIREAFEAGTNKTLATIRADGSPRISATELEFRDGGVTLGMMPGSMKLRDVERDPRVAVHSPTIEPPPGTVADAKLAGVLTARAPYDGGPPGSYFELDIAEAVFTWVDVAAGVLVVESWHPGRGWSELRRE